MSKSGRDDSRGARGSRIGSLGIVTIVVTVLVALALGILYYLKFMERFMASYSGSAYTVMPSFEVQVFARKYDWHFHYPGPDGVFGASSPSHATKDNPMGLDAGDPHAQDDFVTDELVLPCDVTILLKTHSTDVIHTLGNLHGAFEVDAVPSVTTENTLTTPTSPASGTLRCTAPCGAKHKDHHAPYRFVRDSDYESWLNAQLTAAQATKPPPSGS